MSPLSTSINIRRAFFLVLILCLFASAAQAKYGGGTGEPNDPYLIYTAEQMNAIGADSNDWDKHFKLMENIDLSGFDGLKGRPAFNIIGYRIGDFHLKPFSGVFDGNDNKISNFTYRGSTKGDIGLFGYVSGENAEIKNLGLIHPNIVAGTGWSVGSLVGRFGEGEFGPRGGKIDGCYAMGGSVQGNHCVGGLVGRMGYGMTLTNSYSTVSVEADEYVGGLVGFIGFNAIMSNCASSGSVSGDDTVGGLVGTNRGTISNCYATGAVSGDETVGGLVGETSGEFSAAVITDCYATGSVWGYDYIGGLAGKIYVWSIVSDCYAAGSVDGIIDVGGLVGNDAFGDFGGDYGGDYTGCFWDNTVNPTLSGLGNKEDPPEVIGESTTNMQTESTFTSVGWDFITPIWMICDGVGYPRLRWEKCPEPVIEAEIDINPNTLNLQSKGKWITCHIWLPEEYDVADVNSYSVFLEDEIQAQWLWFNERQQVAMARFSRSDVCQMLVALGELDDVELTVSGELADGTEFTGTDTIKVIDKPGTNNHNAKP